MKKVKLLLFLFFPIFLFAQQLDEQIDQVYRQLEEIKAKEKTLNKELEELKLQRIQRDLQEIGLPSDDFLTHSALALEYAEEYEQARWVAHIILPDIINGNVNRTNDFRPDPKVKTGTAEEKDYFLKFEQADGSFRYDGYGYDRGHLAPSADFRWSAKALSESYFYSNMSPQLGAFNRGAWAELEAALRGYIFRNPETQLYVVTGGILEEDLPVLERSVNQLRIPRRYFKVALDLKNKIGVGFIMPNQSILNPLETFAVSIDEVEKLSGLDFFSKLPDDLEEKVESTIALEKWLPEMGGGDVAPIHPPSLKSGYFNTVQAKIYEGKGKKINVCGTVVSTRYSRSGNLWLNIDKQFPNQIFSVFIRKKDLVNFSFQPDKELTNRQVCFAGVVENMNGTPTMNLKSEKDIEFEAPEK